MFDLVHDWVLLLKVLLTKMFRHNGHCILLLLAVTAAIFTTTGTAMYVPLKVTKISPEIVSELKDFRNLIPPATVNEIIAEHYLIDANFREVFNYLRSSEFSQLLQHAQQIPDVVQILNYLHLLIPDASLSVAYCTLNANDNQFQSPSHHTAPPSSPEQTLLEPQLNFLLLNELESVDDTAAVGQSRAGPSTPSLHTRNFHTFSSFVEELMKHLPRDHYVQLINQKRQKNPAFAQFYAALRSADLGPMVDATLKSPNMEVIIETLRSNGIDVKSLEASAFKLISWGPAATVMS